MGGVDRFGSLDLVEYGESPPPRAGLDRPTRKDRVVPRLALRKHDDAGIEFRRVPQQRAESDVGGQASVRSPLARSMQE